jgi:hypothetical protein
VEGADIQAQQMPMLVSAEWLAAHARDPQLIVLHV